MGRAFAALASLAMVACGSGSTPSVPVHGGKSSVVVDELKAPECPDPRVPPDHLSISWSGRDCTVEVGSNIQSSSLEIRAEASPNKDIASARFSAKKTSGTTPYPCQALAADWPQKAGAYDVTLRHGPSGRQLTKRIWIDADTSRRELQESRMLLREVYSATALLDDGNGLFVARLGSGGGSFSDAFTGPQDYGSRVVEQEIGLLYGESGPPTVGWEAVFGTFAGIAPSASRFGDQVVLNGRRYRWTIRSLAAEETLASWAPHQFVEDWLDAPNEASFATILNSKASLRRVSLSQVEDCSWVERQAWSLEVPGQRILTAAAFGAGGHAAVLTITREAETADRLRLQVGGDAGGALQLSESHQLQDGLMLPEHTRAGVRTDEDGTVHGVLMGRLPGVGWSLFEIVARPGKLSVERTTLPVQSVLVGRVDYDGERPIWVVRTMDGRIASGHGEMVDEACGVPEIVPGAPFMGGGTIAWQRSAGAPIQIGICRGPSIATTRRAR